MNKVLLDTDIFSEILKGKNISVIKHAESYHAVHSRYTITTITVLEVIKGLHKVQRENHIRMFLQAIAKNEILTLDVDSAELAGRIYGDLERTGRPIGRADPMIAAIALIHDLELVSGNLRHYQNIQNLGYDLILRNWKL